MKKIFISAILALVAGVIISLPAFSQETPFVKTKSYGNSFKDVAQTEWYSSGVKGVYEVGLMDGVSYDKFDPDGTVTVAQGITIASRLHSIYNDKNIPEPALEDAAWYDKYVLYAIDNGIISADTYKNYNRAIQSYEMITLFDAALPNDFFPSINNVSNLPDVIESNSYYTSVTRFYNAGILNGNDEYGTFYPTSTVTRKRAAVILSRITDIELRLEYTLTENTNSYSVDELFEMVNTITNPDTLDKITIMNIGGRDISAAVYRRYYMALSDTYSGDELKKAVLDNITFAEAVRTICVENNIELPYAYVREFLRNHYDFKVNYGENYDIYLAFMNATDRALCEQDLLYTLYSYSLNKLFGYGGEMSATEDEVFKYAIQNEYISAKHILILHGTENAAQLANEIHVKAVKGEDFDELINKYSQDPGKYTNPDGYVFTKGEMVKEFEDAAYALAPCNISGVVETEFGYHIIKREVFDKETFVKSNSYASLFSKCSGKKGNDYIISISNASNISYVESFDEIISLFN